MEEMKLASSDQPGSGARMTMLMIELINMLHAGTWNRLSLAKIGGNKPVSAIE